jgi:hypothetical protein
MFGIWNFKSILFGLYKQFDYDSMRVYWKYFEIIIHFIEMSTWFKKYYELNNMVNHFNFYSFTKMILWSTFWEPLTSNLSLW